MCYTVSQRQPHRKGKSQLQFSSEWSQGFNAQWPECAQSRAPIRRTLHDMCAMFTDQDEVSRLAAGGQNPLIYEVSAWDAPSQSGALSFGVTVLHPGQIDSEYYMTKGHYHVVRNTAEVYYTLSGEGVLVTENEDGQCILLPMAPGTASYVAPGFAHRMVNTGSQPLVSFYVFRADAGHDYAAIEVGGFRCRIMADEHGRPCVKHGNSLLPVCELPCQEGHIDVTDLFREDSL